MTLGGLVLCHMIMSRGGPIVSHDRVAVTQVHFDVPGT